MPPADAERGGAAWQPILATALAFATLNLVVAYAIARALGMRAFELSGVTLWVLVLVGLMAAAVAVVLWRRYLQPR